MGEEKYYRQLRSDVLKHHSKQATRDSGGGGWCQPNRRWWVSHSWLPNGAKQNGQQRGVVGYFILANDKKEVPSGEPLLAIAISSQPHSRIRANGRPVKPTKEHLARATSHTSFVSCECQLFTVASQLKVKMHCLWWCGC
jgi:hypothetical protein